MMAAAILLLYTVLTFIPAGASGQTRSFGAEIGGSARIFPDEPRFSRQGSSRVSPSLVFAPEFVVAADGSAWSLVGEGFVRFDADDGNRSHGDLRELGLEYLGDSFTAFVGVGQVFWGVTEVRHLVDIVNQVDAVEDLDGEDKLGQPMVTVTLEGDWGTLDLYYLPYFRERTFPAEDARLRGPLPIGEEAVYLSGRGRWYPGFAARAFRTLGAVDLGISVFRGTSREPRFSVTGDAPDAPVLQSLYDPIDQVGVDAQWTGERTLLKLESITRGGQGARFYAVSGGVEHTVYQIFGSDADLGILGEFMLDSRDQAAPPTIFERDVFVGGRWGLNDAADSSVLGGTLVDLTTGEVVVLLEAQRRMGSVWRMSAEARLFGNTNPGSVAHGLRNDGFVSVSLTRFF